MKEIKWESEPTAQYYKANCNDWYESWWKEVGGAMWCKFVKPEHWQEKDWHQTRYKLDVIPNLIHHHKQQEKFMKVEQVFRTEDGEVFDNFEEARQHSIEFNIWTAVMQEFGCYGVLKLEHYSDFKELISFIEAKQKELEAAI